MQYKSILITGANSGIGAALAKEYAAENTVLFLSGRNLERLEKIKKICENKKAKVFIKSIDVTDDIKMKEWIIECNNIRPLNLVIANAGISAGTSIDKEFDAQVRQIFSININGVINTIHPAIELMKEQKQGHIVIISSLAGLRGLPSCAAYSASKAAVKAYGQGLYGELIKYDIYTTVICPGYIKTPLTDKNNFPMPFLMEADSAAVIMKKAIDKRKSFLAFPFILYFFTWLFATIPNCISDFIAVRLPKK